MRSASGCAVRLICEPQRTFWRVRPRFGLSRVRRGILAHVVLLPQQAPAEHPVFSTLIFLLGSRGVLCNDRQSCFSKAHLICCAPGSLCSRQRGLAAERREFPRTKGAKMGFPDMSSHGPDPVMSRAALCITLGKTDSCHGKGKVEICESFNLSV